MKLLIKQKNRITMHLMCREKIRNCILSLEMLSVVSDRQVTIPDTITEIERVVGG
jgi:hypothetical protein